MLERNSRFFTSSPLLKRSGWKIVCRSAAWPGAAGGGITSSATIGPSSSAAGGLVAAKDTRKSERANKQFGFPFRRPFARRGAGVSRPTVRQSPRYDRRDRQRGEVMALRDVQRRAP